MEQSLQRSFSFPGRGPTLRRRRFRIARRFRLRRACVWLAVLCAVALVSWAQSADPQAQPGNQPVAGQTSNNAQNPQSQTTPPLKTTETVVVHDTLEQYKPTTI